MQTPNKKLQSNALLSSNTEAEAEIGHTEEFVDVMDKFPLRNKEPEPNENDDFALDKYDGKITGKLTSVKSDGFPNNDNFEWEKGQTCEENAVSAIQMQ